MSDRPIYEKLDTESQLAYDAFCVYRDMGVTRSAQKVLNALNKSSGYLRQINEWSAKNDWVQRCLVYDAEQERIRRSLNEQRKTEEYLNKLSKYREDNERLGKALISQAASLIKVVQEKLADTNTKEVKVSDLPGLARTAAQCADIGSQLMGQALGVEKLLERLDAEKES
jgi:hypothetical protein